MQTFFFPNSRLGVKLGFSSPSTVHMTEQALADEIIRLQKLDLDHTIRATVDEAAQLLSDGRSLEAEALIENADARFRCSESNAEPANVYSRHLV